MDEKWRALLDELEARERRADEGGGRARQGRQKKLGRKNARERIAALVDAGSFVELGRHVVHRHAHDSETLAAHRHPGDGLVCGLGTIDGRAAAVYAHDPTVLRGAVGRAGADKLCRLLDLAERRGLPVVALVDSDGARVEEVIDAIDGYGAIMARTIRLQGKLAQLTLVCGLAVGGAAYTAMLTDVVGMVAGQSFMFLSGEKVARVVTGEEVALDELGGPDLHARTTGACHAVLPDEDAGIAWLKRLIAFLSPAAAAAVDPIDRPSAALTEVIPFEPRRAYDVRKVIDDLCDAGSVVELAAWHARNLVTCLARLGGATVAIVASQPKVLGGCLDAEASRKGAWFVGWAAARGWPILTLVDVPGYVPGRKQEEEGVLPAGAELLVAYGKARVPLLCLILRKSYGGGNVLSFAADVRLALPLARVAPMGVEAALEVALGAALEGATAEEQAERAAKREAWLARVDHGWAAAEAGYVDRVVRPADARRELAVTLARLLEDRRASGGEVSRVFRSSFPDAEDTAFRTDAWRTGTARSASELKPLHPTVLHAFAMAAKLEDCPGVTLLPEEEPGEEVTRGYRDLYHASCRYAGALARLGVKRGDRVLIVLPTSFEFLLAFFGAQLVGAIPVPSYPPAMLERAEIALDRLVHIAGSSGASLCIANKQLRPLLGELALRVAPMKQIVAAEDLEDGDAAAAPKARAGGADPAFIQYTSGSTGRPKGVLLAHGALVANVHAAGQALKVSRADKAVSWLPLYHDMGLIGGLLFMTYWRLHQTLMSPLAFLSRPARWLWAIHRMRATLSLAPNFAYGMCVKRIRPSERQGLDLSSWRATLNGAEPVNMRTVHDFTQTYAPYGFKPETMYPCYGLAESAVAVTFPRPGDPLRHEVVDRAALVAGKAVAARGIGSMALVGCGSAIPGHEVVIVDGDGGKLGDRDVGNVVVRGPSLMTGYYGDPEATRQVLRDGWLWTGDLGFYADDQLYITGRAKDLIIVRVRNHYAEDIERQAERVEGVRPGGAAAFGVYDEVKATDLVVIVCETRAAGEDERVALVAAVSERVSEHCSVPVDEVVLVPPGSIPKTSSGKRQRPLCRELYLSGDLGKNKTGKLKLAMIFVRSGAGFLVAQAKRLLARQRAPE